MTQVTERSQRKTLEGWVVSDKMDKTRVIAVRRLKEDPKYGKRRRLTIKVHAHDEKNESKEGDKVLLAATRPLSRTKFWRIAEILEKSTKVKP